MDNSTSIEQDLESPQQPKTDKQAAKRRKVVHKHVVRVKINEGNAGKQKSEGPPSDTWSWRKYGQKPIKGSPYPRGYYRCSTSKGCSAKKQVERCKTDASMLIITYTSSHNHAGPDILCTKPTKPPLEAKSTTQEEDSPTNTITCGPARCSHSQDIISIESEAKEEAVGNDHDHLNMMSIPPTPPKSCEEKEDDFFDDLEELPTTSSLTSFVRSCFFDERILLPS